MLARLDLRGLGLDVAGLLPRPPAPGGGPVAAVREVLAAVRTRGDAAVRELTKRFDGVALDELRVPAAALAAALAALPADLRHALEAARDSVEAYHRAQVPPTESCHTRNGITIRELRRPVDRVGAYVPGGRARYPSTVLMTAVPARVAGVAEVALCVPPGPDGQVAGVTLAAAALAGVDEVYRIGGAQAIAAMAYGTESVRPVDVIVGPGNVYVAVAKREVAGEGRVGVPAGFAGPSEVVVVADGTAPVEAAAVDVVVQAEHGPDGLAWLVTWSERAAGEIGREVARLVEESPRRADLESTLAVGGYLALVDGPEQAMVVVNEIAPEHLELMCAEPEVLLGSVRNAGAVFYGAWAPAAVGDYMAGPSHVLPTFGSARFASALRVDDFLRHIHAITLDQAALNRVAPHVAAMAEAEGLPAHAQAVLLRLETGPAPAEADTP